MLRSKAAQLIQASFRTSVHKASRPPVGKFDLVQGPRTFRLVTLSSFSSTTMADVSEMDYEKVKSGLEDKSIVLIDVRTAEERKEKHGAIPGSKHIWSKFFHHENMVVGLQHEFRNHN